MTTLGEMHVRGGYYLGIAPLPGGLANVCLVTSAAAGDPRFHDPTRLLYGAIARDPMLRERFEAARLVRAPTVLGPLAVETVGQAPNGLLLAGDAAGFVDPMTGDGLRFAARGGELAALAALDALEHGWNGVHQRFAASRAHEFTGKWRFNRTVRALVASPRAVDVARVGARLAPSILRKAILYAGDVGTG